MRHGAGNLSGPLRQNLNAHLVDAQEDGNCLLYIDRHLVHEVTSPQAFEGLRMAGRRPARAAQNAGSRRP